jgi:hypothetical protein
MKLIKWIYETYNVVAGLCLTLVGILVIFISFRLPLWMFIIICGVLGLLMVIYGLYNWFAKEELTGDEKATKPDLYQTTSIPTVPDPNSTEQVITALDTILVGVLGYLVRRGAVVIAVSLLIVLSVSFAGYVVYAAYIKEPVITPEPAVRYFGLVDKKTPEGKGRDLNVRALHTERSKILGVIPYKSKVELLAVKENWVKVRVVSDSSIPNGWANAAFITIENPNALELIKAKTP